MVNQSLRWLNQDGAELWRGYFRGGEVGAVRPGDVTGNQISEGVGSCSPFLPLEAFVEPEMTTSILMLRRRLLTVPISETAFKRR